MLGKTRSAFFVLVAALAGVYGLAAWLLVLPPISLPAGIDFQSAADPPCNSAAWLGDNRILFVPISQMPPHLISALLYQEDRFFFRHHGVRWAPLFRALRKNVAAGQYRYGAGTITMQLMREIALSKERTLLRKMREIAYALQVENRFSKRRIAELYLNVVHWGPGVRGVGAASCYYFGIPATQLSSDQSARLVSVLTSPPRFGPELFRNAALERSYPPPGAREHRPPATQGGWPR